MSLRACFMVIISVTGISVLIYMVFPFKTVLGRHFLPAFQAWHLPVHTEGNGTAQNTDRKQNTDRRRVRQSPKQEENSATGRGFLAPREVSLPKDLAFMAQNMTADIKPAPQKKLIVIFNRPHWLFMRDPNYQRVFSTCSYTCGMTDDRKQLPSADAVVVHLCRLNDRAPPPNRPPHQMWVAYGGESPLHYSGHHDSPAWRNVFNWTLTYRTDADFFHPYNYFKLRTEPPFKNYTQIMLGKTKPVAWFVSNCHSSSKREKYVTELKKYINVDIYGSCGTFSCRDEAQCLRLLNTTYYFYLAFENSFCQDYVTEKLFKTYNNVNIIPVVRGGLNYSRYVPPNTYLDTVNFSSPQHLATYLKTLMKDVTSYTGMLRAKDYFPVQETNRWAFSDIQSFCKLCQKLQLSPISPKVYPDIMKWSSKDKCWMPNDV